MARPSIGQILDSMVSKDKARPHSLLGQPAAMPAAERGPLAAQDHRYMAISDLQGQAAKPDFKVDDATERRLCKVVLQQLDDGASDIAGLVVKWCGPRLADTSSAACAASRHSPGQQQRDVLASGSRALASTGPPLPQTPLEPASALQRALAEALAPVRSLGPLVCRLQDSSTETILNDLCSKMLSGKAEQQRDLAAIGIKGIIAEAQAGAGPVLTRNLSPKLVAGVRSKARACAAACSSGSASATGADARALSGSGLQGPATKASPELQGSNRHGKAAAVADTLQLQLGPGIASAVQHASGTRLKGVACRSRRTLSATAWRSHTTCCSNSATSWAPSCQSWLRHSWPAWATLGPAPARRPRTAWVRH